VLPNHPVIGVSWFEVMAFCRWLTADLRERGLLGDDQEIRLPTEIQWERAAR
jgi:formylglycine-generating enzyme required for sulfatase activity